MIARSPRMRMDVLVCGVLIGGLLATTPASRTVDAAAQTNSAEQTRVFGAVASGQSAPVPVREIPASRAAMPQLATPSPSSSFDGLSNQDNFNAFAAYASHPDTDGDVGPNHYVQQVNNLVRVYDKAGTPLTAPFKLSSLWVSAGLTDPCSTTDSGNPVVLYDSLADRWLLSQASRPFLPDPPYYACIAISKTSNPAGEYYVYTFNTPGTELPTDPKLGVWPDAYYMTTTNIGTGGAPRGIGVFAFHRAKMLAGDGTATLMWRSMTEGCPSCTIRNVLPSDLDGLTAPPAGTPNVFAMLLADEFGNPIDGLRLWNVSANFDTTTLTITERAESPVAVAPFDPRNPDGRADIEQPAPATEASALDSVSDRLMHRLAYRNFGTHQSLVVNHTVNVGSGTTVATHQAGVRYYELRNAGGGAGAFTVNEQATFAPDADNRWLGSAAQDHQGNLAVGYSVSSLTTFPSIRYAGRLATDPANGLFQGEATLVAGTGVQLSTDGRWGTYSRMAIDPVDDCTFWYTNEYYTAASQAANPSGWLTHIGQFKFTECTPVAKGSLSIAVTNCLTGEPFVGARIFIGGTLYGVTDAAGTFSATLAPGTYEVSVQSPGFGTMTGTATVTNGGAATLTICLTGAPVLGSVEATLTGESCAPGNTAPDPGERVTYDLTFFNSGLGSTTDLVVTLQPGPGVTSPSAAQSYGVIPPGGSAKRPFSFTTSGACGTFVTATVQLRDGAVDHGTRTFTFALGPTEIDLGGLAENFDNVAAPMLPAGWTASRTGGGPAIDWATTTAPSFSAPNSVAMGSVPSVATAALTSPVFAMGDAGGTLMFRNNFLFQAPLDGGALEISINGGPFTDWIAAGGSFISGSVTGTIDPSSSNPLAGRVVWMGTTSGAFILTRARMPVAAAGQLVQLRWLAGFNESGSPVNAGWRIDDLTVTSRRFVCSQTCVDVRIATSATLARVDASTVRATITVSNTGATAAPNAQLTQVRLGAVNGTPLPQPLGDIPAGGSTTAVVTFTGVPAGGSSLTTAGTYDGGSFSSARRVVVP